MKKLTLLVALLLVTSTAIFAQGSFRKGDNVLGLGIGVGNYGLPVTLSYERAIVDNIFGAKKLNFGVGGQLGFRTYSLHEYNYTNFTLAARGAFHYEFVRNLDTYLGLGLGCNIAGGYVNHAGFYITGYLGARYYFSDNWGISLEFGNGISYATLGAAFKF